MAGSSGIQSRSLRFKRQPGPFLESRSRVVSLPAPTAVLLQPNKQMGKRITRLKNSGWGTNRSFSESPGTHFDWFLSPTYLLPYIEDLLADIGKQARVLMLGCGNSTLGEVVGPISSSRGLQGSKLMVADVRCGIQEHRQPGCKSPPSPNAIPVFRQWCTSESRWMCWTKVLIRHGGSTPPQ
jgi:hypothetical protein